MINKTKYNLFGEDWEQVSFGEWCDLDDYNQLRLEDDRSRVMYFKKIEKWPKKFEESFWTFKVHESGSIELRNTTESIGWFSDSVNPGYEAFKLAKEIRDKK